MTDLATIIPHYEDRLKVKAWLVTSEQLNEAQEAATGELYSQRRKIEDDLRAKHRDEVEAATADLNAKIEAIEAMHHEAYNKASEGVPELTNFQMWDDYAGCSKCAITGLPLHDDDETFEWNDEEALKCVVEAALKPLLSGMKEGT